MSCNSYTHFDVYLLFQMYYIQKNFKPQMEKNTYMLKV